MPGHAEAISHFNFFDFAQTDMHTTNLHTHTHEHASTFCLPVFLCQVSAEPEHLQASGSRLCRHDTSTLLQRSVSNAASSPLFSIMLQTTWCFNNNDNDYGEILCLQPIATKTHLPRALQEVLSCAVLEQAGGLAAHVHPRFA